MSQFLSPPWIEAKFRADFGVLDSWVAEVGSPELRDALLDLRGACGNLHRDPGRAIRTFLRLRPRLRRSSYLLQHRVRRALERRIEIEVSTPEACWRLPLRLQWDGLARTLAQPRRDAFENGSANWEDIRVRLVPKLEISHGQDSL